jgi:glycosyltransferase involved in cell wall biosynthesis
VRLVGIIDMLLAAGWHVVFRTLDNAWAGAASTALQQRGVEVWYRPYGRSIENWLRREGARLDAVVASRYFVAEAARASVRKYAPRARFVFDTVDLHYVREQRLAELNQDRVLGQSAERTRRLELGLVESSDATWVVSDSEAAMLREIVRGARVEVVSNVHTVRGSGQSFDDRKDLVFVGGFRHQPNIDAVEWFVSAVLPIVRESLADVRMHVIGAGPPPQIQALGAHPDVVVHGHVPDLDPYMDGCRVALAPLRFGAGVKGKINLSMAHGQPVVGTSIACEGMHLTDGVDVLVADDPVEFAAAVVRAYIDRDLWKRLSEHGAANVRQHFSVEAARETVLASLRDV